MMNNYNNDDNGNIEFYYHFINYSKIWIKS